MCVRDVITHSEKGEWRSSAASESWSEGNIGLVDGVKGSWPGALLMSR